MEKLNIQIPRNNDNYCWYWDVQRKRTKYDIMLQIILNWERTKWEKYEVTELVKTIFETWRVRNRRKGRPGKTCSQKNRKRNKKNRPESGRNRMKWLRRWGNIRWHQLIERKNFGQTWLHYFTTRNSPYTNMKLK